MLQPVELSAFAYCIAKDSGLMTKRELKSARALWLIRRRRERDPEWWRNYLERQNAARRERASVDPEYRQRRNAQSHVGRTKN